MKFAVVEDGFKVEEPVVGIIVWDEGDVYLSSQTDGVEGVLKVFLERNKEVRVNLRDRDRENLTESSVVTSHQEEWLDQIKMRIPSPFVVTKIGEIKNEHNFSSAIGKIKEALGISFKNNDSLEKIF